MLVRLLYASRAADDRADTLHTIAAVARDNNLRHGITGVLVGGSGAYLQVLEGGRAEVSRLFAAIQRDARHHDVELLSFGDVTQRRFGAWAIGLVDLGHVNKSTLLKYSETAELNPHAVSGEASMALMEELAAGAAIAFHP